MLFLISTPIGNLGDLSYRAHEAMQSCDLLLCEDTRRSQILCQHYNIKVPLKSFHLFNEKKKEDWVIDGLKEGKTIGLLSDAGTPTINDPGSRLVARCQEEELEYTILPGACSLLCALAGSGLAYEQFQFIGFLPKKSGKRKQALKSALDYPGVTLAFESPYRILKTLAELHEIEAEREVVLARELTKKFETILRGTSADLLQYFGEKEPKGEFVLIISEKKN